MQKIGNVWLHDSIYNMPAHRYFAFYLRMRLFEATNGHFVDSFVGVMNDMIIRIRYSMESPDTLSALRDTVAHIENQKIGTANTWAGFSEYLAAFATLTAKVAIDGEQIPVKEYLTTDDLMSVIENTQGVSVAEMLESIRLINDQMQAQLTKSFPAIFSQGNEADSYEDFLAVRHTLANLPEDIDPERTRAALWEIQKHFFGKWRVIEVHPDMPQDYTTQFWNDIAGIMQAVGVSESEMKSISIHAFYSRQTHLMAAQRHKLNSYGGQDTGI